MLGEANVARAFQTSRVPASAALKLLCDEGLISGFGGRGYSVRSGRGSPPAAQRLDLLKAGLELPPQFSGPRRTRNRGNQIDREVEHSVAACLAYGRFMLNESALAEYYGVSRTIAHEVLVKLELAGIAVHDRNQRWYAGPLTADELANRFQVRWMLEPEALRQSFPHLTKSELTRRRDRAYRARKVTSHLPNGSGSSATFTKRRLRIVTTKSFSTRFCGPIGPSSGLTRRCFLPEDGRIDENGRRAHSDLRCPAGRKPGIGCSGARGASAALSATKSRSDVALSLYLASIVPRICFRSHTPTPNS